MISKKISRLRRARQTRIKIAIQCVNRLCVYRSNMNIYAQIISPEHKVLAVSSSLDPDNKAQIKAANLVCGGNVAAAKLVGTSIAIKAKAAGIVSVAFDRSGYKYHGRVKALADAARENGLTF